MSRLVRLALAAVGGGALAVAHSTLWPTAFLAPMALALLAWLVTENWRLNWGVGFVAGMGFFLGLLPWMNIVGADAWVALSAICAFWWGLGFAFARASRLYLLPILLTAAELLRDRLPWGGFGWGQIGVLAIDLGPMSGWLPIVGQVALTAMLWGSGVAIVFAIRQPQQRIRLVATTTAVLALGGLSNLITTPSAVARAGGIEVAVVQAGVDRTGLGVLGDRRAVLKRHVDLTRSQLQALNQVDLVIWPENSSDVDPFLDPLAAKWLADLDAELDPPLLIGAVVQRPNNRVGNVTLQLKGGLKEVYAKQRLVPFGEFMPLRDFITAYTSRAELMPRDFIAGETSGAVEVAGTALGILICFEVADDNLAWDRGNPVAALVVQTNNATYDGTEQSEQQFRYARARAAELRLPVLVASTNGVSGVIAASGEVEQTIEQGEAGVMIASLPRQANWTLAAHLHDPLVVVFLLGAAAVVAFSARNAFTRRRFKSPSSPETEDPREPAPSSHLG